MGVMSPGVWPVPEQPRCAEFAVGNAELIISQTALAVTIKKKYPKTQLVRLGKKWGPELLWPSPVDSGGPIL